MKEKNYNELSQALRALAEANATQEAAPQVETTLLKAFRQQAQPEAPPMLVFPSLFARKPFARRFAWAAAALLLLSFGWFGWHAWQRAVAPQRYATKKENIQPQPVPASTPETRKDMAQVLEMKPPAARFTATRKLQSKRLPVQAVAAEEEIATEFFPLVAQDVLPARGQLRRIEVPRATLINFGLPVNAERIEFPIKADVLVGEDGAARAIRFIQERLPDEAVINVYGYTDRKTIPTSFQNLR